MGVKSKKSFFDAIDFDEIGDAMDLWWNTIQNSFEFDAISNKDEFIARVISPPVPIGANSAELETFANGVRGSFTDTLPKFIFRARMIEADSHHVFWPDPCDPEFIEEVGGQQNAIDWIQKHVKVMAINATEVPRVGDTVKIKLNKQGIYTSNPENAIMVGSITSLESLKGNPLATTLQAAECETRITELFKNYSGKNPMSGAPKPPVPLDKKRLPKINRIVKVLYDKGITNKYAIGGILSVIGKELGGTYTPKGESSYATTSPARIREIWSATSGRDQPGVSRCPVKILAKDIPTGTFIANLSDDQIRALTKQEKRFWEFVYGGRFGNKCGDDAFKYRGGGLNQITFRIGYETIDAILGTDYTKDPTKLHTGSDAIEKGAAASWAFFTGFHKGLGHPNTNTEWNALTDYETASIAAADKNGGVNPHPRSRANSQRYLQGIIDAIDAGEIKIPPTP